jgi:hypothetical protein
VTIKRYRTEICNEIIGPPSAWKPRDIGTKDQFKQTLSADQLAVIDQLLDATRRLKPQEVTRQDFNHPVVNALMADVFEEIQHGRGFVVLTGVTRDRYSDEDFERIYWGLGTHLGEGIVQSPRGDRLGRVQYLPPSPDYAQRAYTSQGELVAHADTQEIVGLMCVRRSRTGGASGLVSSLAAHNELLQKRPDLLEPLYDGYQFATREAIRRGQELTPYTVPVFSYVDGTLSCYYNRAYINHAEKFTGPIPPKLREAMDYLNEFFAREENVLTFMLEPGEMLLWHNFTMLHSRTHFEDDDDPAYKRLLLRLWLNVPKNGRPMVPVYYRDLVNAL